MVEQDLHTLSWQTGSRTEWLKWQRALLLSRGKLPVTSHAKDVANRFARRQKPQAQQQPEVEEKRRPRKLEMRLNGGTAESVAFSAPFLDNTLSKMLQLQNRMLKSSAELSKMEGVDERVMKEHAAQSAELSRIIALICAEKARQGA